MTPDWPRVRSGAAAAGGVGGGGGTRHRAKPGDHFAGSHGLGEGGSGHEAQPFEVVGVLANPAACWTVWC
jgi:hypothetical protein